MAKVSIKVVVAGRTYPLTVEESEQAAIIGASEDINRRIKVLQENYAVKDVQDLLAMTALQLSAAPKKTGSDTATLDLSAPKSRLKELLTQLSV